MAALKVLTWNIYMMPTWARQSPKNKARARAIAVELLKLDYDVLCFEKAFDGGARDVLRTALGARYPHRYGPANAGFSLKINSGVWVLSRLPLSDYHPIEYRDSSGIESFSRKGALLLRGAVEGRPFQIAATHLQGSPHNHKMQQIRNQQMVQLQSELLARHGDPGMPLFLCGDFCTPRFDGESPARESPGYQHLMATFGVENGSDHRVTLVDDRSENDMAQGSSRRRDEVDYILLRNNRHAVRGEWRRVVLRRQGWDGPNGRVDLSYRYAVGATFTWL